MYVVGLTGGVGSGKSAASACFKQLGRPVIDADVVAREVVEPGEPALEKIVARFGGDILTVHGTLDRSALRQQVFDQPKQREWLEQLLHPLIRNRILEKIEQLQGSAPYVVLASPLLLETDQHKLVDHTVVMDVPEEVQLSRTMQRDNNSEALVKKIMQAQLSRAARLEQADSVIDNSGNEAQLLEQVKLLDLKLKQWVASDL